MEQKVVNSHRINTISHKNIIKRILWEKENDVAVKDAYSGQFRQRICRKTDRLFRFDSDTSRLISI